MEQETLPSTIKTIQMKSILLVKHKYVVTRYFFDQQKNTQVKQYNQQKKIQNTKTRKYESYNFFLLSKKKD